MTSDTAVRTWLGRPTAMRQTVLQVACITVLVAGCGSERIFGAEEFVDAANQRGAGLVLGSTLTTSRPGVEVYALTFQTSGESGASTATPAEDTAGSLLVSPGSDEALAEYARCQSGGGLICYRAANVVLLFEGAVPPDDLARVTRAVRAMGSE
jgi:hypothetical protein